MIGVKWQRVAYGRWQHLEKFNKSYSKNVEEAPQTRTELSVHIRSLELSLKAERNCIAHSESNLVNKIAEGLNVFAKRESAHDAVRCHVREKEVSLSQTCAKLPVAHSE